MRPRIITFFSISKLTHNDIHTHTHSATRSLPFRFYAVVFYYDCFFLLSLSGTPPMAGNTRFRCRLTRIPLRFGQFYAGRTRNSLDMAATPVRNPEQIARLTECLLHLCATRSVWVVSESEWGRTRTKKQKKETVEIFADV